jgi:putative spermidine/putrescine transport system ATP-binding protein
MTIQSSNFRELRLDRVSRTFGALNALKGVSLTVRRGEFIALLGPSGCGKSTALNCLAGLLPTTGGGIWLDDKRIDTLRPEDRGFGMVFQNYALFPHMSVRKNIGFGLMMRGAAKARIAQRVDEALAMVRLKGQEEKLPGQLSGGQQQRVAIARAIVVEPPLVLMDEPLSNLDAKLRLEMRAEIRRIHNALGAATIYVTHDQEEAMSLADRIVVMRDGEVRQIGTPAELFSRPAEIGVAEFMGFRNRFKGRVVEVQGEVATVDIGIAHLTGYARDPVKPGDAVVVAVRPDDVEAVPPGPTAMPAQVYASEFRGREFAGFARTKDGQELSFASPHPIGQDATVHLAAHADRVLVFAESGA